MILNLAGFRINLLSDDSRDTFRLSVCHAGLLDRGPGIFTLTVQFSDQLLFRDPLPVQSTASLNLASLQENQPAAHWKMGYSGQIIRLQGFRPERSGLPGWEMALEPRSARGWLRLSTSDRQCDPLQYPIDALLIFYLLVFNRGVILHASGASFNHSCLVFAGESGSGKSTIARYCQMAGARILHDDRVVIRKTDEQFHVYRMPLFPGNLPMEMPLDRIFFIEHSHTIHEIPVPPQVAFEKLAGHSVQHPFYRELVDKQMDNLILAARQVPCFILGFPADPEVGRYLNHPAALHRGFTDQPVAHRPAQAGLPGEDPIRRPFHDTHPSPRN